MDPSERATLAVLVGCGSALAVAYAVDEPIVWLAWAVATALVAGAALIAFNR